MSKINRDISTYGHPVDVPWFYKDYVLFSEKFYWLYREGLFDRRDDHQLALDTNADVNKELVTELRDCANQAIEDLDKQYQQGIYMDDALCNEAGITIDLPRYYKDQAKQNEEEAESLKGLLSQTSNEDEEKMVLAEIEKQIRFAKANNRKANIGTPFEKEMLMELLSR
jgi:hypothetical protein